MTLGLYWTASFAEAVSKGEDDTETVLHITAAVKTPQEMAEEFGSNDERKELLEELLKPEYREPLQIFGKVTCF